MHIAGPKMGLMVASKLAVQQSQHKGLSCKIGNIPVPGTFENQNCQFYEIHHFSLISCPEQLNRTHCLLVCPLPLTIKAFKTLQSDPRDLWPLGHLIRVMRRHDLTKKDLEWPFWPIFFAKCISYMYPGARKKIWATFFWFYPLKRLFLLEGVRFPGIRCHFQEFGANTLF